MGPDLDRRDRVLEFLLAREYTDYGQDARQSVLELLYRSPDWSRLLNHHPNGLRVIPEEPNAGLREFAVSQILEACIRHGHGHEELLLDVLSALLDDDDVRIVRLAVDILETGRSELEPDGGWRDCLVDVARDDSRAVPIREAALEAVAETTAPEAVGEWLVSLFEMTIQTDSPSMRETTLVAMAKVVAVSQSEAADIGAVNQDLLGRARELVGRSLSDTDVDVRRRAAQTVAAWNEVDVPLDFDGYVEDIRRLVSSTEFDPEVKVELVERLSHVDDAVCLWPRATVAADRN
jgi:hypothetical protein